MTERGNALRDYEPSFAALVGSGQVAADTITSAAGSTGTGITMTMVITLNQQPATSNHAQQHQRWEAGRRNNKIKLV